MDEPLASLDEARKAEILPYIERLRDEVGIPIVYVSHSMAEVARLATTVALVDKGRGHGLRPDSRNPGAARPCGASGRAEASSLIEAKVAGFDPAFGLTLLETRAGPLQVARAGLAIGQTIRVRVLASDVLVSLARLDRHQRAQRAGGDGRRDRSEIGRRRQHAASAPRLRRRDADGAGDSEIRRRAGA